MNITRVSGNNESKWDLFKFSSFQDTLKKDLKKYLISVTARKKNFFKTLNDQISFEMINETTIETRLFN